MSLMESCKWIWTILMFLWEQCRVSSSAKRSKSTSLCRRCNGRSLIKRQKSNGPRIDPWGTPRVKLPVFEMVPLQWTAWVRWDKYDIRKEEVAWLPKYNRNFCARISCLTRSNAFLKSRKTDPTTFWELRACNQVSHKRERPVWNECLGRKPGWCL